MWWAKVRFLAPSWRGTSGGFLARSLRYPELSPAAPGSRPAIAAYEQFAPLWHAFIAHRLPDYPGFLAYLARRRHLELRSVLDVGCGTAPAAARLAEVAGEVVGIDTSDAMLAEARRRWAALPNVSFLRADFREFHLGRTFAAALAMSNALNYVAGRDELATAMRCIAEHIEPGGLFVFDTITERGLRLQSGFYFHGEGNGTRYAIHFRYDPAERRETSVVYLPSGTETHYRVPLDPPDVAAAAGAAGLRVEDYFSFASVPGHWFVGTRCFFVLAKQLH